MKLTYLIDYDTTIKEFIYKKISRNFYGYLKEHNVSYIVNGIAKKSYEEIRINDELEITYDECKKQDGILSNKPLDILYEDEYYLVVYKPAHLQSIPSRNNPYDSVFNRLLYYFKDKSSTIHLLNRLDKETKGLILVAKNNYSAALLKNFSKKYIAITHNKLLHDEGIIDLPISRVDNSIKREVNCNGQKAVTIYKLIDSNDLYTYEIELKTGRTHQIRVHFSYHNCPLINDTLYGGIEFGDLTLGLICKEISFIHPITNKVIIIKV